MRHSRLFLGFIAFGVVNFSYAQSTDKKAEAKLPPPMISKNKTSTKPTSTVKFPQPIIIKAENAKSVPTPHKNNKAVKKSEKIKVPPSVIIKDKSTN